MEILPGKLNIDLIPYEFVERERTERWVMGLAMLLYESGLSLRNVADTLSYLDIDITWRGVHYWIQKLGEILEEVLWKNDGDLLQNVSS